VVGAIALFLVLAAVMVATRKVNWYGLSQAGGTPGRPLPPKPPSTPPVPPTPTAQARPGTPRTEAA
jgi:inner membrane protein